MKEPTIAVESTLHALFTQTSPTKGGEVGAFEGEGVGDGVGINVGAEVGPEDGLGVGAVLAIVARIN